MAKEYLLGSQIQPWKESDVKNITFIVTENCNLVCKYCYLVGKNTKNRMSFETAKKAVDYILNTPEDFPQSSVIWDFIGGEPFLEIELIDQICDYIKTEMYRLDHRWFESYRFSFSSNGTLYDDPRVQRFIEKNRNNLSIGISVDGNKIKHDMQRVKPDGTGSYEDVVRNVPLWLSQFPGAFTKATFAHDDLPYLKDSVIHLWELGIREVAANVVFEDTWEEGDAELLETQLKELADYIIENHLWDKYNCSFFSDTIGFPLTEEIKKNNWCGAGKMLAIDWQGNFFPCVRFADFSLTKRPGYVIGNVKEGYDHDKLRPFLALDAISQSSKKCIDCEIASGCAWCQGMNYDEAKISTIYQRATYICNMHKARVRANEYYWARMWEVAGIEREILNPRKKFLYFLLSSDNSVRHCTYGSEKKKNQEMSLEVLKAGLEYARYNFFTPILLLPPEGLTTDQKNFLQNMTYYAIHAPSTKSEAAKNYPVYDNQIEEVIEGSNCILILKKDKLPDLYNLVINLFQKHNRINLILEEVEGYIDEDLSIYERELEKIVDYMVNAIISGKEPEINVLSDRLLLDQMANCNAGIESFTLGPDGNFYICPAFYYDDEEEAIGNVEKGVTFNYQEFLTLEKSPICSICDAFHCRRCVYQNKKVTLEYLIPGRNQCVISHVERKISKKYHEKLVQKGINLRDIKEVFPENDYMDPLEKIINRIF